MTDETRRPEDVDGGHLHDEAAPTVVEERPAEQGSAFRRERRTIFAPVVVAAVVAALIGGGVGAGVTLAVQPDRSVVSSSTDSGRGVVINNPSTATNVSAIAAKAAPSVVTISVSASQEAGTGSGIVLTSSGYVLTNNHVVTLDGDTSGGTISVTTSNGRVYKATIVKTDPTNDLAVIKLQDASGLTPATWGNSSDLNVGDQVVAIGAPLDLPNTVTTGIVSALNRSIAVQSSAVPDSGSQQDQGQGESPFNFWNGTQGQQQTQQTQSIYLSVLQTDAAINPGNSGGALVDGQGRVIGVNVAIAGTGSSSSGQQSGSIGLGFAIPSDIAKRIADDLMAGKTPTHGQLGIEPPTSQSATTTSGSVAGAPVPGVSANSPAAKAGIKAGDVITAVDGVAIADFSDLTAQIRAHAGGSRVEITYSRGGTSHEVQVVLGTVPTS